MKFPKIELNVHTITHFSDEQIFLKKMFHEVPKN